MNNYIFYIAIGDIRPVGQQPLMDRKDKAPCEKSVYWINMNTDTEYSQAMHHMLGIDSIEHSPRKAITLLNTMPWEAVSADGFMINGKALLCAADYHSKFPIMKEVNSLSADHLVR